jgi:ribonuclease E
LRFVRDVMPSRAKTIKLYTGDRPLFNKFNLEEQIERIYKRRVPLPSGGEIVIDGTEALTAIDVNSARSKRSGDIEENNTLTNLEAAAEIARQLRLRDLGGLIVIDFIDLTASRNRSKVERAMREALKGDRARHDVTRLSKLGLMELARQRIKGAKMAASYNTCSACDGYGLVKNVETAALAALRKLQTRSVRGNIGRIRVGLPPDVAAWLSNNKREELVRIERRHDIHVEIVPAASLLRHEVEFEAIARPPQEKSGDEIRVADGAAATEASRTAEPPEQQSKRPGGGKDGESGRRERAPRKPRAQATRAADGSDKSEKHESPGSQAGETSGVPGEADSSTEPSDAPTKVAEEAADAASPAGAEAAAEPAASEVAAGAEESDKDEDAGARDSEGKTRRRRRRKRRPRSGAPARSDGKDAVSSEGRTDEPHVVPRGVRADELMPAASGSASGQKANSKSGGTRSKARSGNGRRRRRSAGSGRA